MLSAAKRLPKKLQRRILEMLQLHLRAQHLRHIQGYHASRARLSSSYNSLRPKVGPAKEVWRLPFFTLNISDIGSFHREKTQTGWIQFLEWKQGLRALAEIRTDNVVTGLATGPSVNRQYEIIARILAQVGRKAQLGILAVPALHFRAFFYFNKLQNLIVVPLQSPVVFSRVGGRYKKENIVPRLQSAFDNRLKKAIERTTQPAQKPRGPRVRRRGR